MRIINAIGITTIIMVSFWGFIEIRDLIATKIFHLSDFWELLRFNALVLLGMIVLGITIAFFYRKEE